MRVVRGRPAARFERIPGRRAEALDALVYAFAARSAVNLNLDLREDDLRRAPTTPAPAPKPAVIKSQWMESQRVRRDDPGGWR